MGKTADTMTQRQALQMRMAINVIMRLTDKERYCVAIAERFTGTDNQEPDYELHLYLRDPRKSGLIDLALLAHAIENMGTSFLAINSTYDAGTTKGTDERESIKIW